MVLLIDAGNSTISIGLERNGEIVARRRATTPRAVTADELAILLDRLLALDGASLREVDAFVWSSVVPAVSVALDELARAGGYRHLEAHTGTIPLAIRVDRPGEVGADRLVNALAAVRLVGVPVVVVDLGTATTFSVVAPDGAFIGGAIAPGLVLGLDALAGRTARLPRVFPRPPERVIGKSTTAAIQAGAVLGHLELVKGLIGRIRAELAAQFAIGAADVRVVLTGGLSNADWIRSLEEVDLIDPDLTIRGLLLFHAALASGPRLEVAR